jgi:hypothetical protein
MGAGSGKDHWHLTDTVNFSGTQEAGKPTVSHGNMKTEKFLKIYTSVTPAIIDGVFALVTFFLERAVIT